MNGFGRKIVKTALLGGAIMTGFAVNTTDSKASEIEALDAETQVNNASESTEQTSQEKLQAMDDATEVIEGDAVAEEGYYNQAKEAINKENLSEELSEEIMAGGTAVYEQAKEKKEIVDSTCREFEEKVDSLEPEIIEVAKSHGLEGYAEFIETYDQDFHDIDDYGYRLLYLNGEIDSLEEKYGKELNADYEERSTLEAEANSHQNENNEIKDEIERLTAYQEELESSYKEICKHLNDAEYIEIEYNEAYAEITKSMEQVNKELEAIQIELSANYDDYNQAVTSLNDIFQELKDAEKRLEEAANRLGEISENEQYEEALENYNKINKELNERSEQVRKAKDNLIDTQNNYSSKKSEMSELETSLSDLQSWFEENGGDYAIAYIHKQKALLEKDMFDNNEKIDEAWKRIDNNQEKINQINDKLQELSVAVEAIEEYYFPIRDKFLEYKTVLYEADKAYWKRIRMNRAYEKVDRYYQNLSLEIEKYELFHGKPDIKALVDAIKQTEKEIENTTASEAEYVKKVNEAIENDSITVGQAESIKNDASAKIEEASKKNKEIHEYYEQIKDLSKEVERLYNRHLDSIDDSVFSYDIAQYTIASDYIKEYVKIKPKYESQMLTYEDALIANKEFIESLNYTLGIVDYDYDSNFEYDERGDLEWLKAGNPNRPEESIDNLVEKRREYYKKNLELVDEYNRLREEYLDKLRSGKLDKKTAREMEDDISALYAEILSTRGIVDEYLKKIDDYCIYYRNRCNLEQCQKFKSLINDYRSTFVITNKLAHIFRGEADYQDEEIRRDKLNYIQNHDTDYSIMADTLEYYRELMKLETKAASLVEKSDKELEKATNNYNEVLAALEDFYSDVVPVDVSGEYKIGDYTIKVSVVGKVKGNLSAVNIFSSKDDILENIWGGAGVIKAYIYNQYGELVDSVEETLNIRLS